MPGFSRANLAALDPKWRGFEVNVVYTLSGAQYLSSLANVAWLDPKYGSVTLSSGSNSIHGYNVQPGLDTIAQTKLHNDMVIVITQGYRKEPHNDLTTTWTVLK